MTEFVPPGSLLLSVPQLMDPNFMHSVVLVVEHSAEGAYGLVLNRPLEMAVQDLFREHEELADCTESIYQGGPVSTEALQFIHRLPDQIPGGLPFGDGNYLGGNGEELIQTLGDAGACKSLRLFLGYSGWGAGQLEEELAVGSWVVAPHDPDLLFSESHSEVLWRSAMRSLGSEGDLLSRMPPDISWN